MIDRHGRKYRRKIGQPRKSQSIYDNLGHPYDIKEKEAIFIGTKEEPYCLTKNKSYTILDSDRNNYNWDKDLEERARKTKSKRVETYQGEDYFITIINDKGNKRQYSHMMFKMKEVDDNE